jgi:hypothetical protein
VVWGAKLSAFNTIVFLEHHHVGSMNNKLAPNGMALFSGEKANKLSWSVLVTLQCLGVMI